MRPRWPHRCASQMSFQRGADGAAAAPPRSDVCLLPARTFELEDGEERRGELLKDHIMHPERTSPAIILTGRLELRPMSVMFFEAYLAGDVAGGETAGKLRFPPRPIAEFDRLARFWRDSLVEDPVRAPWLARALVRREDRVWVGHLGCHDRPGGQRSPEGEPPAVEVGYTVFEPYRRQGYAREGLMALIEWARGEGVMRFLASISPENGQSGERRMPRPGGRTRLRPLRCARRRGRWARGDLRATLLSPRCGFQLSDARCVSARRQGRRTVASMRRRIVGSVRDQPMGIIAEIRVP